MIDGAMAMEKIRRWILTGAILLGLLLSGVAGAAIARAIGGDTEVVRTKIEKRPVQEVVQRMYDLAIENEGLRNRLRAREERQPERIIVSDTVVKRIPADTVVTVLQVDGSGMLNYGAFSREFDSLPSYRPFVAENIDVSDCDDGFSFNSGNIVCDRPRFGHLYLYGMGTLSTPSFEPSIPDNFILGEIGFAWTPTYRSSLLLASTYGSDGRFRLRVSRGIQLW